MLKTQKTDNLIWRSEEIQSQNPCPIFFSRASYIFVQLAICSECPMQTQVAIGNAPQDQYEFTQILEVMLEENAH